MEEPGRDHLTASAGAMRRRDPAGRLTLGDCLRTFLTHPSPWVIGAALTASLVARVMTGHWSWRDPVIAAALITAQPLTEWVIHVYLLHSKPVRIGRRTFDLPAAREHREHHAAPADLDQVLIPMPVIALLIPAILLGAFGLGFAIHPLIGGDRVAGTLTGIVAAFAVLGVYEWTHFLIHTPYVPKRGYYRHIHRSHRLHHYKNEHYWFGVTSNCGDDVLGTNPDQSGVERSATARALHGEA